MIQAIIINLGSLNRFAKIVKGVDIKQKIVTGILITKGIEHINRSNFTMHHMMTMIKINQNSDEDNEDSFIIFMALDSLDQSPTSLWILDT